MFKLTRGVVREDGTHEKTVSEIEGKAPDLLALLKDALEQEYNKQLER